MKQDTRQALDIVATERQRQDAKWGNQAHSWDRWMTILTEEVGELARSILQGESVNGEPTPQQFREAVQVAAVAVAMIEDMAQWFEGDPRLIVL